MIERKNDFKIEITKGTTLAFAVKFKNISQDLSSAYFTVKMNSDDLSPTLQKSIGAGISKICDRSYKNEKVYKVQIMPIDTINMQVDAQYLYDLQVTVGNVVKTILSGFFVVKKSVTGFNAIINPDVEIREIEELEASIETIPATNGVEYEQDPVACTKIGNLTNLQTTEKNTLVGAINENTGNITTNTGNITTNTTNITTNTNNISTNTNNISTNTNNISTNTTNILNITNGTTPVSVKKNNNTMAQLIEDENNILKIETEIISRKILFFESADGVDKVSNLINGKIYEIVYGTTLNRLKYIKLKYDVCSGVTDFWSGGYIAGNLEVNVCNIVMSYDLDNIKCISIQGQNGTATGNTPINLYIFKVYEIIE